MSPFDGITKLTECIEREHEQQRREYRAKLLRECEGDLAKYRRTIESYGIRLEDLT